MSDKLQIFIPLDMHWQPSQIDADAAVALLWSMSPDTDQIEAVFTEKLEFQDSYGGARCPVCDADLQAWFFQTIIAWYEAQSEDLHVVTPCCHTPTTIDALRFGSPVSFYRFQLLMMNSRLVISDNQIGHIEKCLGTKLKVIYRRV